MKVPVQPEQLVSDRDLHSMENTPDYEGLDDAIEPKVALELKQWREYGRNIGRYLLMRNKEEYENKLAKS